MSEEILRIGIVTVSDRASRGEYEDRGGPAIREWLENIITSEWEVLTRVVPDEREGLEEVLRSLCDEEGASIVITTGGTGPAPRDITVDATKNVIEKELPGFGELMRAVGLKKVPTAILSRQTAGLRGSTLIINLPGKPAAIAESLDAVFPAVTDCMDLIGAPDLQVDKSLINVYRPHTPHTK